jgi:hypothetical protein
MKNIGSIIKRLQNTMRKDQGVSGDAQRIEQLGWMITCNDLHLSALRPAIIAVLDPNYLILSGAPDRN